MNTELHVSIDLEALGTKVDAPLLSIGACVFDYKTGKDISSFLVNCNPSSKSVYDVKTIMWWLCQSDNARLALVEGNKSSSTMYESLGALTNYISSHSKGKNVIPWGNGATFDISILERNYNNEGMLVPWAFYNIRDMRTIVTLAEELGFDKSSVVRDGVHHSAVADAVYQAKVISAAHNVIVNVGEL